MHIADDTLHSAKTLPSLSLSKRSVHTRVPDARIWPIVAIDTPSRLELGGRSGVPSNKSSIDGHDTTLPTVSLGTGPQPAQIQITGVHIAYRISHISDSERRKINIVLWDYRASVYVQYLRFPVVRQGQLRFLINCVTGGVCKG